MNSKRILGFMLCLLLAVSMLTACNQQKNGDQTAVGSDSSTPAQSSAAPTETPKGDPIKLVFEKPIWGSKTVDDPTWKPIHDKILEKFNIDLQVVGQQNPGDQDEKPKLMLASGEQLDFFNVGDWTKYKKSDNIIPLNELLDKYGQDIKDNVLPKSFPLRTDKEGKIWAIPYEQNPVSVSMLMRKDWLDELGLQVPTTIEEFEKVMQVFKEKKNDEGFVQLWDAGLESTFGASFYKAGDANFLDTDGKIKPYYLDPKYKDFLAKMNEWYKKGYIHKEIATMQYQQAADTFHAGGSGVTENWLSSLQANIDQGTVKDPKFNLVGVPPLKGPEAGAYRSDLPYGWGTVINKNSKHPEEAMKLINWMSGTEEGFLLTTYGVEGQQWEWADKEKGIIKLIDAKKIESAGGETDYTTGWLVKFASKFAMNKVDGPFMNWLNDKSKVNTFYAADFGVVYDVSSMKSKDNINTLDTLFKEARWKVIMGDKPVSYWDEFIKKWMDNGGTQWIEDYTAQYNELKK